MNDTKLLIIIIIIICQIRIGPSARGLSVLLPRDSAPLQNPRAERTPGHVGTWKGSKEKTALLGPTVRGYKWLLDSTSSGTGARVTEIFFRGQKKKKIRQKF